MSGRLAPETAHQRYLVSENLRAPRRTDASRAAGYTSGTVWASRYRVRLVVTDTLLMVAVTVGVYVVSGFNPTMLEFAMLLSVLWSISLTANRTRSPKIVGVGPSEYKRVVSASIFTFGALAIAILLLQTDGLRTFFFYSLPVGTVSIVLSRWLWRHWLLRQRRNGKYMSRTLVVGPKDDVLEIARRIDGTPGTAYTVVGAVLDGHDDTAITLGVRDVPVICGPENVALAVRTIAADTVIVAGQYSGDQAFVRKLSWSLEETSAEMVLASGLTDIAGPRIHMRPVEGFPLMHVELPSFDGPKHLIKRSFDLAVSGVALLLLSPLLLAIAMIVKLDSSGPILFRQERVGKDGRTFKMLKFRSMVTTAEDDLAALIEKNEGAGVLFKIKNDPRVTRVGRVLRAHSLDELPQLWNILVGDMSIVGPRPPLPREVNSYEDHVNRRLYIKPGLTGLWQISGRSDLSWEESVRLDLYYVENWSFTGDLVIMWRTVKVLLNRSGAY